MASIRDLCKRCFLKTKQPVPGGRGVHTDTHRSSQGPHLSACLWPVVRMDTSDLQTCLDSLSPGNQGDGCRTGLWDESQRPPG